MSERGLWCFGDGPGDGRGVVTKKRWSERNGRPESRDRSAVGAEFVLTATAVVDLARRPPELVRGCKAVWLMGMFVQPIGPIAYLALGRRTDPQSPQSHDDLAGPQRSSAAGEVDVDDDGDGNVGVVCD